MAISVRIPLESTHAVLPRKKSRSSARCSGAGRMLIRAVSRAGKPAARDTLALRQWQACMAVFSTRPSPATLARKLGSFILTETMVRRPELGLVSYELLFPNRDALPKGGFGNLIALPMQKQPRGAETACLWMTPSHHIRINGPSFPRFSACCGIAWKPLPRTRKVVAAWWSIAGRRIRSITHLRRKR